MKRKKIGIAILLGMALCVSTAFTAVSVYGAEASETSDPVSYTHLDFVWFAGWGGMK